MLTENCRARERDIQACLAPFFKMKNSTNDNIDLNIHIQIRVWMAIDSSVSFIEDSIAFPFNVEQ